MSLKRIVLRDFVIVSELELEMAEGFSVLTGETGAGKSILIDALQMVTGARADSLCIREGASRTEVSAEFDSCLPAVAAWLRDAGFEEGFDQGSTLLLRRTLDTQGKSRAWINGSPATATQLRELGQQLLDIHGQHAWQSLTTGAAQRDLLDAYARIDTHALQEAWTQWRLAFSQLEQAQSSQQQLQQELDRLVWQIAEVDKLSPQYGEWDELQAQHSRLSNAQGLLLAAQSALEALDSESTSASSSLAAAQTHLSALEHVEPQFGGLLEVLQSSLSQVEDTVHTLRAYVRRTDLDPEGLAALDERLSLWVSLARRYKRTPEQLPELWSSWKAQLVSLTTATDLDALERTTQAKSLAFMQAAQTVTVARTQAAPRLAQAITQAMQGLGMQGGQFEVALQTCSKPQAYGLEDVQFLVAGHAGSTPKPVGKVASGGELSRMALAIAVTTSQLGSAQTLIFDEVDSGIGGAVAETVGRLMKQLGRDRQVLAVTHLPQVAACADHHCQVIKSLEAGVTTSTVQHLEGEQRVAEVARMLGGERMSATTLAHAKEMLQSAH